jgi:hypothetical protein
MKHITTCHLGTHYDFTNVDLLGQLRCKSTIKGKHIVDYKVPSFSLGYLRYILESDLTIFLCLIKDLVKVNFLTTLQKV